MEALTQKRARLRQELQQAYGAWMRTAELAGGPPAQHDAVDISGCGESAKAKWCAYLAARERLILAYAEQPVTG